VVGVVAFIMADKSGLLGSWIHVPAKTISPSTLDANLPLVEADWHLPEAGWLSEAVNADTVVRWSGKAGRSLIVDNSSTPSGSSASSSSGESSSHGEHSEHQHDAMLFLFMAILTGTLITHATTYPIFSGLQQTVVLFVIGIFFSVVLEVITVKGNPLHEKLGVFGRSYTMWMGIEPHLMLFTMLPALLTGDAMTLDTSVAKRVAKQCIYLASVGVMVNALATAAFLYVYSCFEQRSFLLCLTTGAILCATDPVAVVALLKELGASPSLTVQIQGESLLNDGTAIVLYTISYDVLKGKDYDFDDIVIFLVQKACLAFLLGMVIGYIFFTWIKKASSKLEDHSSMIQVSLTLCCAYWSFIIAEGVFHISGVLSTVAAALVLAHFM